MEDTTASAAIHFRHAMDPAKNYIFSSMAGGVLLLDYDGDGWLDIYFTNSPSYKMMQEGTRAKSALYHNNRDGTFTDVTEKAGVGYPCAAMGGAVGDYNNDGLPDMLITCLQGLVLYRNNGDGTFTDVTDAAGLRNPHWNTGAGFADYDGDGWLDLAVTSYAIIDLYHLPEPGSAPTCRYQGVAVQCGPHGLHPGTDRLFHNTGHGTFTDASASLPGGNTAHFYGLGLAWADFDGSGRQSLFIAHDSTPNKLFQNLGHRLFKEVALDAGVAVNADGKEQANMGVALGDYLHTGFPSIALTTFAGEPKPLYRNDGHLQFTEVGALARIIQPTLNLLGWGIALADLDNDGWLDLLSVYGHVYPQASSLANSAGYLEPKILELNKRDGTFCSASALAGPALQLPSAARGLAVGDLFNDGQLDAVIENIDGSPLLLRNRGIGTNHWIELSLVGTRSNRLAVGAEVAVKAAGVTQTAEVHSGSSYLSQDDLRLHFGLADAGQVDDVTIRWPSGNVEAFHTLPADHIYSIVEGSGHALLAHGSK